MEILILLAVAFVIFIIYLTLDGRHKSEVSNKYYEELIQINFVPCFFFKSNINETEVIIDTQNELLAAIDLKEPKCHVYDVSKMHSFELVENGKKITFGGSESVAGGLLFGTTGAVVGASLSGGSEQIQTYQLRIIVDSLTRPEIVIDLIARGKPVKKSDPPFIHLFDKCQRLLAFLTVMQKRKFDNREKYSLLLESYANNDVIKLLSEHMSNSNHDAFSLVSVLTNNPPSTICNGLNENEANNLCDKLARAGAVVKLSYSGSDKYEIADDNFK